jgi:pimeloyl-ACP methyl ester carboxylesterase
MLHAENAGKIAIHWESEGTGDPVVLVGGLTSTVETWALQVAGLATRHRVVTFDNRGSGRTAVPDDDGVRTTERFAHDVLALLDGLGLERVHLAGASMGGMIVQEFALRWPERLRSLAILCSTSGGPNAVPAAPEVLRTMIVGSVPDAAPDAARAALGILFHASSFEERAERVAFYVETRRLRPHAGAELARRATGLASHDTFARLPGLAVPTLVLSGSHDQLIPTENARRLAGRIPGAELALVEPGGHVFFVEQPAAVNRALLEFFAKH